MAFDLIWVFAKFAGNFDIEREVYNQAGGDCNEALGMPAGKLLSLISCGIIPASRRPAADDNIRFSRYVVIITEDSWDAPPGSFRHDYNLALKCKADPELPLREVVVFFRKVADGEEKDGRLDAFRKGMDPTAALQIDFVDAVDFRLHLDRLFARWVVEV